MKKAKKKNAEGGIPVAEKKDGGCWGSFWGTIKWGLGGMGVLLLCAIVGAFLPKSSHPRNNIVLPSQTPRGETPREELSETQIPMPSETPIPLPTNTLIASDTVRIDELFLGVTGVTGVELASEQNEDERISAVAIVTISPNQNLYIVRDAIWTNWVYHAQRTYSYDKPLFIDLTITQNGIQSIWQKTSGTNTWIQVGGIVPTLEAQTTVSTALPRPANCDQALAWGYTAEQAGQFPNLDRDGDGVACYGD